MKRNCWFIGFWFICLSGYIPGLFGQALVSNRLAKAVEILQGDSQMKHAIIGLTVLKTATGEKVYEINAQTGLAPASCQKTITSAASMDILGPQYRYQTVLGYDGIITKGVLNGNLYVQGSGDPSLGSWRFDATKEDIVFSKWISVLHEIGIEWWDKQLEEYEALPGYKPFPDIWAGQAQEFGRDPAEFQFWALTARSMQYAWGANVGLPLIQEMAQNVAGHDGIIINRSVARKMGIRNNDAIVLESPTGKTHGRATLREGIRPDTVLLIGQFDHWITPYAKNLGVGSLNSLTSLSLATTDATGSGADLMRVSVRKDLNPPADVARKKS